MGVSIAVQLRGTCAIHTLIRSTVLQGGNVADDNHDEAVYASATNTGDGSARKELLGGSSEAAA